MVSRLGNLVTCEGSPAAPARGREQCPDVLTRRLLINNTGIMPFDNPGSGDYDDEQAVGLLQANLLGPARVSAAFVEHLKRQPDACIINNSSVLAYLPLAATALYSATKAALHSYSLSQRFALRDTSLKVLEIAPPWVDTDLIHKSGDERAMPLETHHSLNLQRNGESLPRVS